MMRLAFVAVAMIIFSFLIPLLLIASTTNSTEIRGFGLVLIGPFPLFFDTSDSRAFAFIFIPVILLFLAISVYMYLRTRGVEIKTE
ncbi:MAG: DUF131 domain-containing protein [Candidatus Caldarchaeum sp.]